MKRSGMSSPWSRRAPLLVMILVLLLTVAVALVLSSFVRQQQRERFDREAGAYTEALRLRLSEYERMARAARAAWRVHPDMLDEGVFSRYVDSLDIQQRYPGVQALAHGVWLPDGQTAALTRRQIGRAHV